MSNLSLERAIDCNDGEHAAKIIQDALGIMKSDDVVNYVFRELGRPIVNDVPAKSVSGCGPRRASWRDSSRRRFPPPWTFESEPGRPGGKKDRGRHRPAAGAAEEAAGLMALIAEMESPGTSCCLSCLRGAPGPQYRRSDEQDRLTGAINEKPPPALETG